MNKRIVVTGLGALSGFGAGVDHNWNLLINGKSAISRIPDDNDYSVFPSKIAARILKPEESENGVNINDICKDSPNISSLRKADNFILYAMIAAKEAIDSSQLMDYGSLNKDRVGVSIGSGVAGVRLCEQTTNSIIAKQSKGSSIKVNPYFLPSYLLNMASGYISIKYGLRGTNDAVVAACATGNYSIINAVRSILLGESDAMIAGSCEAALSMLGIGGFCGMHALSKKYNDAPETASRPWDKGRDGFVIGEGAGVLVIEDYEHAKKRGAKIYADITGYGCSADASDVTAPNPFGAEIAIRNALKMHGDNNISYINAHGTSTPLGDASEIKAMLSVFGSSLSNIPISSTKSAVGHMLGAASSVEAIFAIRAIQDRIIPPTLNLHAPMEECNKLNMVPLKSQEIIGNKPVSIMSNSFGFGGTNTSVIFSNRNF